MIIESVATVGAVAYLERSGQVAVGVNNQPISCGRIAPAAWDVRGTPIQRGRTLQLWLVELTSAEGKARPLRPGPPLQPARRVTVASPPAVRAGGR